MAAPPKGNILLYTWRAVRIILTRSQKVKGVVILLFSLLGALLDVGRLAALIPVMVVAMKPEKIHEQKVLSALYDRLGFTSDDSFIIALIVLVLVFFLVGNAISLWLSDWQTRYSYHIATDLARRQHLKYFKKGLQYFKKTNSSDIINNIRIIPGLFASGILIRGMYMLGELMVMVIVVASLLLYDIRLVGMLVLVLGPSSFLLYRLTRNRLYHLGVKGNRANELSLKSITQGIRGFVDVKISNKDRHFRDEYLDHQDGYYRTQRSLAVIQLLPQRAIEIFAVLGVVVIFTYAVLWAHDRQRLMEFLIAFAAAAFRVLPSINRLLQSLMSIKNHQYTIEVLTDDTLPTHDPEEDAYPAVSFQERIEFRNLGYSFDGSADFVLKDIDFSVRKGEKIGIIGPSGSGKTTLMNILLRFYRETEGAILLDGQQLDTAHERGFRDLVGYVQQDVFLLDGNLRDNIAFGVPPEEVDEARLRASIERASLGALLDSLPQGLDTPVGEMGARLSGGQRQRMGIARALYRQSQIIVFDEATSALDNETEKEITEAIRQSAGPDTTIFVIAHRITTLRDCDRILELRQGRMAGWYSYEELVKAHR
jgi:ABC-type multidrug transport system fused ATPase/permease subunit